jgi:hypothetical protein
MRINPQVKKDTIASLNNAVELLRNELDGPQVASAIALIEIARSLQRLEEVLVDLPAQF